MTRWWLSLPSNFIHLQNSATFIDAKSTSFNDILHTFILIENTFVYTLGLHSLMPVVFHSRTFRIHSFLSRIHSFTRQGYIHWCWKYSIQWHSAYIHFYREYIHLHAGVTFIDTKSTPFNDILHTFIFTEHTFIRTRGLHSLTLKVLRSMTFCIHSFLQRIHSFALQGYIHWH